MCKSNILYTDTSDIQGEGLFCKINLKKGECIGLLARVYGEKDFDDQPHGNFINHSKKNNITLEIITDNKKRIIYVIGKANKYIKKGEELTANYYDEYAPSPNFLNTEKFQFNKFMDN